MKKYQSLFTAILLFATIALLNSCKKDPTPEPEPEQEEFNGARIDFILLDSLGAPTLDTTTVNFDYDGAPDQTAELLTNRAYDMQITLLLDGKSINDEINEEGTLHQFFFFPSVNNVLSYSYGDQDADGRGIGLTGILTTTAPASLDLTVILRHGLDKSNAGAQEWNSPNYMSAGGEDDLNITFPIVIN